MNKKELFEKEKLFISEFTDDFFESKLKKEEGLEEWIQECANEVLELQGKEEGFIWHSILEIVVRKVCQKEMMSYFEKDSEECSELEKIIVGFYGESFFLKLDIAQKITYNLYRIGENDVYDMENNEDVQLWEEEYRVFLDIGRNMSDKDLAVELMPELTSDRLEEKYNKTVCGSKVFFPKWLNGSKVKLEREFAELHVMYIGNEKFQNYLCHSGKRKENFDNLVKYIRILDEKGNGALHYIWEKLTNFNAINLIAKFLIQAAERNGVIKDEDKQSFAENVSKEYYYLFRQIIEMPNVLTRLLLLKQIFDYVLKVSGKGFWLHLKRINLLLTDINSYYNCIQEIVLEIAVYVRWVIGRKKRLCMDEWIHELEKEYSTEMFEELLLSLNIDDGWYNNLETDSIGKGQAEPQERDSCLLLELERHGEKPDVLCKYFRKRKLLKSIGENKYVGGKASLSEKLQREGWFHISSNTLSEFLEKECEGACKITPYGAICTMCQSVEEYNVEREFEETVENLETIIGPCLLSEYKGVIFENILMNKQPIYEKIFEDLLYHIK